MTSAGVLLPVLLVALALLPPPPASAQLPFPPCSSCNSCDLTSCTGCSRILNNTCPTNAGWCYGCTNCNGTSCGTCNTIGFQIGCADVAVEQRTRDFIAFLFIAILAVILAVVVYTMWRRNKQRRAAAMQHQGDMALSDLHNPTYAQHDAYGNPVAPPPGDAPHFNQGGHSEPYSYYYASTASPNPAGLPVAPSYPAAPPGYPGYSAQTGQTYPPVGTGGTAAQPYPGVGSAEQPGAMYGSGPDALGPARAPSSTFPLPTSTNAPPPFSSSDQLTPLPGAESPTALGSGRRGRAPGREQRQSLLSEEQRAANSSTA